jgi:hypothetical protein
MSAQNLMGLAKEETMMSALHLPKNAIKYNYQEIVLPTAMQAQSISPCIFPQTLEDAGAIQMLPKI